MRWNFLHSHLNNCNKIENQNFKCNSFKIRFQLRQWLNLGERKSRLCILTFSKQIPVKHRIKCTHIDGLLECHLFQTFWRGIWIIFTKRLNIFLPFILVTRVYVPQFFVSSQQRFGATDIKALGASQLLGLGQTVLQLLGKSVLQLYFI